MPGGNRCPDCRGTGFSLRTDEAGVTTAVPCPCRADSRGDVLLRQARFPRRYAHCTLDGFEVQHESHDAALAAGRGFIEQWPAVGGGLFFVGPPGTGKTHLAVAIARALIERASARVLFYEQRELLKALQGTFDAGAPQREAEILRPVLEAELLVLDDLGAGRTTPWARDVMHDIIAHRYNAELPLLMTSNLALDDEAGGRGRRADAPLTLRDRLGDALMSRLYEMCRIVAVGGRDYRVGVLHAKHRF